ncbi:hypothetical protein COU96_03225 [Candidatus Shapirobacteria bacterium CG10_big_fil_rev_8_21_14_0_10_38_14]|uniref:Phosphatidylglycerol--prolipoprotein diacylglyceryl transferase n=1 Tax=Candidatus Shapirobacteria bacterium CG10_big_fil_rev_8_21_14_0_10_38_14 TaxID=1974483 RepID=A0A2M8L4R1_9BACT|nr:MAG: hypothetical protein COU96_03225 [Candidatus Shapirobacteria bacterium CG10_big_fil_rev_8_21_14_0_10_38_14]
MLPVLFSIGPITVYSLGFLLTVGAFLSSFVVWRRLRELGIKEEKTIDFILTLAFFGLIFARIIYIFWHFDQFGFSLSRWFLLGRYSGLSFWGGMLGFWLALWLFIKREKKDFWQLADELSFGLLPLLILAKTGCFFDGCSLGKPTNLFWGIYFPGTFLRRQPVSALAVVFLFLIFLFLIWLERRWRLLAWYKSKACGFVFLTFLSLLFLVNFILAFWRDSQLYFYWAEIFLSLTGFLAAVIVFYFRSGRKLRRQNEKKKS